jgi:ABC-2 type transport system permease protein
MFKLSGKKQASKQEENPQKSLRRQNITMLILGVAIIVFANIIASFVFTRIDLTSEKRYTLSDATKELLTGVNDYVYFKVYLDGDFPAGFKRLRNETREMLDEFRAYNTNIEYEFIDPNESENAQDRQLIQKQLIEKGLNPTQLEVKDKEGSSSQLIFPGAVVTYRGKEMPVQLLADQSGNAPEETLNNSIQNLEYNLANTIRKLVATYKPKVAFIYGHGELGEDETYDIRLALSEYYGVERVKIDGKINALTEHNSTDSTKNTIYNKYKAIVIARPDSAFTENDKFIIDQYIMRGGRVLWLVDGVNASIDTLMHKNPTMGLANEVNLEDQLFKYGVRVNYNLLLDASCLPIMLVTGRNGNQPKFSYLPWMFFPLIMPASKHPVVNNLNAVKSQFISSIDTIAVQGIKKTFLLSTTQYSRSVNAPVIIDLNMAKEQPDPQMLNQSYLPVAVLLEGKFESVFKNRIPHEIANDQKIGFMEKGRQTQMIVISDGDIIRNQLHRTKGYPLPLGFDQDTRQSFGNKEFILNAMNYMIDDTKLVSIRSRELKIRLLDRKRVEDEKLRWQVLNVVMPVVLIILFGIVKNYLRKRKFAKR